MQMSDFQQEFTVKLGSVSMYCRTHKEDMVWINDKEAVCPHCLAEELGENPKWIAFMARVWLEKYKNAKLNEEE